jgi:hypothetical protein
METKILDNLRKSLKEFNCELGEILKVINIYVGHEWVEKSYKKGAQRLVCRKCGKVSIGYEEWAERT